MPTRIDDERDSIQDQLDYLAGRTMDRDEMSLLMSHAVADGVKAAMSDPVMWSAVVDAIQKQAAASAGGWLLGGIKTAFSRLAWLMVIGLGIYLLGGWSAIVGTIKALGGSAGPP